MRRKNSTTLSLGVLMTIRRYFFSNGAAKVTAAINSLTADGVWTNFALDLLWAQHLLNGTWNTTWGGGVHPAANSSKTPVPSLTGAIGGVSGRLSKSDGNSPNSTRFEEVDASTVDGAGDIRKNDCLTR